jgi:hypothetical protein
MTPLFPAQRAAEEFDQALGGTATQAVADRYAELLDTVAVLRDQPEVIPRAEFVGELRSRLMTAAETQLVATPSVVRHLPTSTTDRTARTRRRLGSVAAALVIAGGSAGMAAAASGALPGETLYPVKLGVEQVTEAVLFSDVGKGKALLDQAATRLDEVQALRAQDDPDAQLIATTLASFRDAADEGSDKLFTSYESTGDVENIGAVRSFAQKQMGHVEAMAAKPDGTGSLVDAADTLADIDQQARVLCAACDGAPALAPSGALSAGAGRATVDNLLSRPVAQAQHDIEQLRAARADAFARLKAKAEETAHGIPTIPATTGEDTTEVPSLTAQKKVTSTITKDGSQVPPALPSAGTAVTNGAKDLTKDVTGLLTTLVPPGDPVGDTVGGTVKGLRDTVDKTVDGLLPAQ